MNAKKIMKNLAGLSTGLAVTVAFFNEKTHKPYSLWDCLELMEGVEPSTYALRMRRSAIEPHQQTGCVALRLSKERSRRRSKFPTMRQRRMIRRELY